MSKKGLSLDAHLFVCTNEKSKSKCCGGKGAAELRSTVKDLVKERPEWKGRIRVNAAGCLGHCENGIAAVLYPQGKWFTNLKADDSEILIKAVEKSLESK